MQIKFKTSKLKKQFANHKEAEKAYGRNVARKFIQRVEIIKAVKDIETLQTLPGLRCHPLIGDRKGQWAINLTGFYRLIFTIEGEALEVVCIEEVSKHYDQ